MPAQGEVVLVAVDPDDNNGTLTVPAIVTRVWPEIVADPDNEVEGSPEHISARVQNDGPQVPEHRTGLVVVDDLSALKGDDLLTAYQLLPGAAPAAGGE